MKGLLEGAALSDGQGTYIENIKILKPLQRLFALSLMAEGSSSDWQSLC
jgi:hypothetical protein